VRVAPVIKFVLETIMQHAHSASSVLSHINLTNLSWQSNAGHVIEAALRSLRLDWSRFGKRVWRVEAPGEAIEWRERAAKNTLRPAPQRASTIGELDDSELQHDTAAEGAGSAAAKRAAAAARPEPPHVIERERPDATDRLKRGTGWGNVPRTLAECCMCEQEQLDALLLIGQEHALTCGAPLKRVHSDDEPFWSSHSMGVVNVFSRPPQTFPELNQWLYEILMDHSKDWQRQNKNP
jgi:hypothetical protein